MPNQPKTPKQGMRIDQEKWTRFGMAALEVGSNRTEIMNQLIDWWLRTENVEPPERASAEELKRISEMTLDEITEILRRPRRRPEGAE